MIYVLQDKVFLEPLYIDFTDIDSEWLSLTGLRIIVDVLNPNDVDCEIDVRFEVMQSGEATQIRTLTLIIEANHKQEIHADFHYLDSTKQTGTRAEIVSQREAP